MIVDDDAFNLLTLEMILKKLKLTVDKAYNGYIFTLLPPNVSEIGFVFVFIKTTIYLFLLFSNFAQQIWLFI